MLAKEACVQLAHERIKIKNKKKSAWKKPHLVWFVCQPVTSIPVRDKRESDRSWTLGNDCKEMMVMDVLWYFNHHINSHALTLKLRWGQTTQKENATWYCFTETKEESLCGGSTMVKKSNVYHTSQSSPPSMSMFQPYWGLLVIVLRISHVFFEITSLSFLTRRGLEAPR